MSTGARGEATIQVGDDAHAILFTNRAVAEVERALDKSALQIIRNGNDLSMNDAALLLRIGLEYGRRDRRDNHRAYTVEDAFAILDEAGFMAVARAILEGLSAVLTYGSGERTDNPPA